MILKNKPFRILLLLVLIIISQFVYLFTFKSKTSILVASYHSEVILSPSFENMVIKEAISYPPLLLTNDFIAFKEALAFKESQGKYSVVNVFGYMGKYQFGKGTLALVGIKNPSGFLQNPELQERAFNANLSRNKWVLRKDIKRSSGKYINGVKITESGILAAAHLAGPGAVKNFLRSNGKYNFSDAFGTSIIEYMKKFKSYDVSVIKANRRAKA